MTQKISKRIMFWVYIVYVLFFIFWCSFVWFGCGSENTTYPSTSYSILFGMVYGKIYYEYFKPWITGKGYNYYDNKKR